MFSKQKLPSSLPRWNDDVPTELCLNRRDFLKSLGAVGASIFFSSIETQTASVAVRPVPKPSSPNPHIILIIVDALLSDHVSANGYSRSTTPNLDAWIADQGVSFTNAKTPSPWTYPANAAIMTGYSPFSLNATWDNTVLPDGIMILPEHLQRSGYYTAGFTTNAFLSSSRGFSRGFDLYDDSLAFNPTSFQGVAGALNTLAMEWLGSWTPAAQPLFLFLYYVDPHTWYHPLPPYDTLFDPTYTGSLTPDVYGDGQSVVAGHIVPTARDIEHLVALYDGECAYWDHHLDQILAELEGYGILEDAIIIVTSDHGQVFGAHDEWTHGNCLYEEVLRVPLLIRYPGVTGPGQIVNTPVQNMDLMPTILDWLGIEAPQNIHAASLRNLIEGNPEIPRDLFSEIEGINDPYHWAYWNAPRDSLRSIQRGVWKYIHHINQPNSDELYLLNSSSVYETENLIQSEAELAEELYEALFQWFGLPKHRVHLPCIIDTP